MDDQRWKQIEGVYLAALDASDRAAFLAETCTNDPGLREAIDLLLTQEPSTVSLIGRLALVGLDSSRLLPADRELLAPDSELGSTASSSCLDRAAVPMSTKRTTAGSAASSR